ncbi:MULTISPECIES: ABC transporter ATP-binding protein [unclassified Imperialibacter]|uniref:ABC transporter ATP-binding protein n=1 Tax=unclassified Imperialibacter TaxID=2629706 RepID=UPI00125415BF
MVEAAYSLDCTKKYADRGRSFSLEAELTLSKGSFTALMGPSGAGKTTLLRLLAGLEKPDSGVISASEFVWSSPSAFVAPHLRHIGYVFQDYALFPHLNVKANIQYGFREEVDNTWLEQLLTVFKIQDLINDRPASLSGGQQQRVALARALAAKPALLLLDEPMAALDFSLRNEIRGELKQMLGLLNTTAVMATHDLLEATILADHVVWLEDGKVVREGAPREVLKAELLRLKEQTRDI